MFGYLVLVKVVVYILTARLVLTLLRGPAREIAFALVNLAGYCLIFIWGSDPRFAGAFAVYLPMVLICYFAMKTWSGCQDSKAWLAFFTPIFFLIILRYVPTSFYAHYRESIRVALQQNPDYSIAGFFVGISYLAFRNSHLVIEVRNGVVERPSFWKYLGFSFFVPTMLVGPINPYSNYRRGFETNPELTASRSLMRLLTGAVKYLFLGNIINQLSYSGMLLDDHFHRWTDLIIAAIAYYLYLYCNFSGFCDMAIGAAGLIGIPVSENFNYPLAARNMREFWNRWHITLSQYMRDVCFSPLSFFFGRLLGPANTNHAVALTIFIVFLLIGIWHGVGWNYAVFGILQAIGVITAHYYGIFLKKRLGRDAFKAYNANPWIKAAAIALTFSYYAVTLFFFANSPAEMNAIFSMLR